MVFEIPLYPITDTELSGLSHAEQVSRLIAGGARLIQLREKVRPPQEFYEDARQALKIARASGARIIINDRVDIAMALNADGVHVGQGDLPPEAARRLLGPDAIIGFSTHNLAQALAAAKLPVDYIAAGPVFPTLSKANPDPPMGLDGLREIRHATGNTRLVAIGGITPRTAAKVTLTGVDAVAMIGALVDTPAEITDRTLELVRLLGNRSNQ